MTASKLLNGQLILEEYFVVNPEFDGQYGPFCKRASTLAALVNPEFDGQYGLCCMRASTLAAQKNSGVWLSWPPHFEPKPVSHSWQKPARWISIEKPSRNEVYKAIIPFVSRRIAAEMSLLKSLLCSNEICELMKPKQSIRSD